MAKRNPFAKLEKDEPFSKNEQARYPLQKQHFIRGIQLRDKCNKKEAIQKSDRYFLLPNKERKTFANSVQKAIWDESGGKKSRRKPRTGQLEPIVKKEKPLPVKEEKEPVTIGKRTSMLGGIITEKRGLYG